MEIKNMNQYFTFEILRRGYDYYKKGKVKEILKLKDGVLAQVSGSESYSVTIAFHNDKYEMKCNCPYAEGNHCKHMAAVLYCLKNNDLPIKENTIKFESVEITNFQKFQRSFKKEYNKLFHNRTYIHQNEMEDYISLINYFAKEGIKYIKEDIELAYDIFEFLIMNIDELEVYDQYNKKEDMFSDLFEAFEELFHNERIFVKFLALIGTIYTIDSDKYYFEHKEAILELLYQYIEYEWQAEETVILLKKLEKEKRIYDYQKQNIKTKRIYVTYDFIDKEKGLELAEQNLDLDGICNFLLNLYQKNQQKQIEILEKIISVHQGYSNEKYYSKLLGIYRKMDKKSYLELLKQYFFKHPKIETYLEIKRNYTREKWNQIKKEYLKKADDKVYIGICIEEEYYDELIEYLKNKWIDIINSYLDVLLHHRPKETLELYKNKLLYEIDRASDRKSYQCIVSNFNNMIKIPHGKEELRNIIKYIRENYKNRKALQEEIDFYEETYL